MVKIFPIIFVLLWSSAFITTKPIIDNSDPFAALAFRFFFVALGFLVFSIYVRQSILINKRYLIESVFSGVLFHGFYLGGVFYSISIGMPTGLAALIVTLQPILTNILSGPLLNEKVDRIILIRPAVEAGEKLGFLPGDLSQKVDPYLRPLYDALYEMLGVEKTEKLLERGIVEIAPLAYMRGRTLNNSFIIVDESQNTTKEQMKMVLTRMGFGSYLVINGDLTQIDLPKNIKSGLSDAIEVLKDTDGIGFTNFSSSDVVRHPLVKKIIDAYKYFEDKLGL